MSEPPLDTYLRRLRLPTARRRYAELEQKYNELVQQQR